MAAEQFLAVPQVGLSSHNTVMTVMPEIRELWNFYLYLFIMIQKYLFNLSVIALRADYTVKENQKAKGNGRPIKLNHLHQYSQGSDALNGTLWPPSDVVPALANNSSAQAFYQADLRIQRVHWHPRRIILELGPHVYISVRF